MDNIECNTNPPLLPKNNREYSIAGQQNRANQHDINYSRKCLDNQWKYSHKFFKDGQRSIDFVLVWNSKINDQKITELRKKRIFEQNLRKEGLELEYDTSNELGLEFIKIHATIDVCRRYCEILRLRMPMKKMTQFKRIKISNVPKLINFSNYRWFNVMLKFFKVDKDIFPEVNDTFTATYSRDKEYLFDINVPSFFTSAIRARVIQFILEKSSFTSKDLGDTYNFGIENLINGHVYCAAYPLHDGLHTRPGNMRYILDQKWASIKNFYKLQPLDYVKEYFGVQIALYFTWLGFYTYMLIPAAVVGFLCVLYSIITLQYNEPSNDICNENLNITMCPLCDSDYCSYWKLEDTCLEVSVTYLFNNPTTVVFTIFMCFWATLFLELWKRYSAEITHRWDLTGYDQQDEYPRPQYLTRLKDSSSHTINTITDDIEPKVSFWALRLPLTIFSFSVVLLLVAVAFAAVVGVVLYRISIIAAFYACRSKVISSYALLLTNTTGAIINLTCIVLLNSVYTWLAKYLTELELPRTQSEFDDSLTLKMYLFEFVNYYASIFYIVFYKGKWVGHPNKLNRIFGYRQEECGPGGCFFDLSVQLSIIMIGKQAFNTFMEITKPFILKWWNTISMRKNKKENEPLLPQWIEDYKLIPWGPQALFPEYLEMVLQYGFVTIFVSAFPLAPIFALLNNILEMRLDAKKMLRFYQRPVIQRVKNIGIWYRILDSIGKLAVFTNGFIIAFTSDFIPKIVYMFMVSPNNSLSGYVEFSLSYANVSELDTTRHYLNPDNITYCRYADFRNPPSSPHKYKHTFIFWHILVARLLFIAVFQNFVTFCMILIRWCIPDIPARLKKQIQRENYMTNQIIISQEALRVHLSHHMQPTSD